MSKGQGTREMHNLVVSFVYRKEQARKVGQHIGSQDKRKFTKKKQKTFKIRIKIW